MGKDIAELFFRNSSKLGDQFEILHSEVPLDLCSSCVLTQRNGVERRHVLDDHPSLSAQLVDIDLWLTL